MYGILIDSIGPGGSGVMRVYEYDAMYASRATGKVVAVTMPDEFDEAIPAGTLIETKQVGDYNEIHSWAVH